MNSKTKLNITVLIFPEEGGSQAMESSVLVVTNNTRTASILKKY